MADRKQGAGLSKERILTRSESEANRTSHCNTSAQQQKYSLMQEKTRLPQKTVICAVVQ